VLCNLLEFGAGLDRACSCLTIATTFLTFSISTGSSGHLCSLLAVASADEAEAADEKAEKLSQSQKKKGAAAAESKGEKEKEKRGKKRKPQHVDKTTELSGKFIEDAIKDRSDITLDQRPSLPLTKRQKREFELSRATIDPEVCLLVLFSFSSQIVSTNL